MATTPSASSDELIALEERYGVVADDDMDLNRERFASVRSIAAFVAANRTK